MGSETRLKFVTILVVTVAFLVILLPIPGKPDFIQQFRITPGIDLAGGAELRYRMKLESGDPAQEFIRKGTEIIRKRIEGRKLVKEPKVTSEGADRIIIQIATRDRLFDESGEGDEKDKAAEEEISSQEIEEYKKLIETTGKLELFAEAPDSVKKDYAPGKPLPPQYKVWTHGGETLITEKDPLITGKDIRSATPVPKATLTSSEWAVAFKLKDSGSNKFDKAAARLFPEEGRIAIVLDDEIQVAPVVRTASFGGTGEITGGYNEAGARSLSIVLESGDLPRPIILESESFVGPSLGQDAINRGLWASGLTLILVAVFMLVYYRGGGFVAVVTLGLNLVLMLGIMSIFGATLTMPGIAGIILTVGLAVDANILILERIREEQARGRTALQAFEAGQARAMTAIMDANVTTFLVGIVLYYVGTGPVQGFAVTLCTGIITTLISVLFCGKTFLQMMVGTGMSEFKMMRLLANPSYNFLRLAVAFVGVSVIVVGVGTGLFFARGEDKYGPDFRGGALVGFQTSAPRDIDEVRDAIKSIKENGVTKHSDAQVQTVAAPGERLAGRVSRNFQVRDATDDLEQFKKDLHTALGDVLSPEPFQRVDPAEVPTNQRILAGGPVGAGWHIYFKADGYDHEASKKTVAKALKEGLSGAEINTGPLAKLSPDGEPLFLWEKLEGAPEGAVKVRLSISKDLSDDTHMGHIRSALTKAFAGSLTKDPFTSQSYIGPVVATELKNRTVWAMGISWALLIMYIAVRFASWRYGVAAVLALVHDALIALAFTSLAGWVIPRSWGVSFDMNMTSMAAILTIIGFSINDTIVIFDRIRENLLLMKKESFREVINTSINQTLSRTILTSLTTWIAAIVLYIFTMSTGGGIAEFAFPLIIGVLAGTYSTIYIASPVVLWWYRGQRPQTT